MTLHSKLTEATLKAKALSMLEGATEIPTTYNAGEADPDGPGLILAIEGKYYYTYWGDDNTPVGALPSPYKTDCRYDPDQPLTAQEAVEAISLEHLDWIQCQFEKGQTKIWEEWFGFPPPIPFDEYPVVKKLKHLLTCVERAVDYGAKPDELDLFFTVEAGTYQKVTHVRDTATHEELEENDQNKGSLWLGWDL